MSKSSENYVFSALKEIPATSSNGTKCENASNCMDEEGNDVFMDAVKVAEAAFEAKKRCEEAKDRIEIIETFAQQAREEYENVHEVAVGLASTATAVATIALKICAYSSFKQAFTSSSEYREKMKFDDFMSTISTDEAKSDKSRPAEKEISTKPRDITPHLRLNSKPYFESTSAVDSERSKSSPKNGKEKHSPGKNSYKSHNAPTDVPPGHGRRRFSLPTDPGTLLNEPKKSEDLLHTALHKPDKDFASEKFPVGVSPSDYKESLEETFTASLTSMTPLWEDRYIDVVKQKNKEGGRASSGSHGTGVTSDPATWTEKKLLKQFQMKLQQVAPLDDFSNKDKITDDRPSNPTPPEAPRLLTPYSDFPPHQQNIPKFQRFHDNDGSDEEDRFDDAQEALEDCRDAEIANLFNRKLVSTLKDVDGRETGAQRLAISPAQMKRPVSPLLNREEKIQYGIAHDDKPCQGKHVFQPKK